jgi:biopolymer transport protein ExbD
MAGPMLDNGANRPARAKLMAEINITPMVDVMLVLLVIFMVTAPLLVAGVRVDLPRSGAPKLSQLQKPIVVTLAMAEGRETDCSGAANGRLYIGDDYVDRDGLEARLTALRPKEGEATVYVRADRNAPYGQVLELLGRIGQAGFQRISLLSKPADAAARPAAAAITPPAAGAASQ